MSCSIKGVYPKRALKSAYRRIDINTDNTYYDFVTSVTEIATEEYTQFPKNTAETLAVIER